MDDRVQEPDRDRRAHARRPGQPLRAAARRRRGLPIVRVAAGGGASQAGVVVARMAPPCNPAGIAFGPDGRLYLSGFGAAGDEIGVVTPNARARRRPPASQPARRVRTASRSTRTATSTSPTAARRRAASSASARTAAPRRSSSACRRWPTRVGVGRQNQALAPGTPPANQSIVANGLAFDRKGVALHRRHRARRALARRDRPARQPDRTARLRHDLPGEHALPRRAVRPAPRARRRRRHRARPQGQRLRRRERAQRDRRRRPRRPRHVVLPQPARRGQPAQRGPARVPDEPGDRRPDALHDELGRRPPRQRPEHARARRAPARPCSERCRASTSRSTRTGCRCRSTDGAGIEGRLRAALDPGLCRRNRPAYP